MSYDYDFKTILKSALFKNNCPNKSVDAFNNSCMYAPFTIYNISNDDGNLECTTESMMYNNNKNDGNYDTNYNYESLIESKEVGVGGGVEVGGVEVGGVEVGGVEVGVGGVEGGVEVGGVGGVGVEDSSNFFMQGSMKDNYKIVDNNFKEIAEKILLDINCDEDTLNTEVVNYEQKDNNSNITKIVRMYNDFNKKIDTLRIEINAIDAIESNLQTIIDNLKINNNNNKTNSSMENKFKNNMSSVVYYNTYFKFIVYLKQRKNILEDNIDNEQLNLNAIMYLVMKNKWFEIAPNVYKLFNQHLPY